MIDKMDLGPLRRAACICSGTTSRRASASAPAVSTPVGPPPTITKFSAPFSLSSGRSMVASRTSRMRRTQPFGVVHRVERKRVLGRSRRTEEVRLRTRCQDEVIPGDDSIPTLW